MRKRTTYLSYTDIRNRRRRRITCVCFAVAAIVLLVCGFFGVRWYLVSRPDAVETGAAGENVVGEDAAGVDESLTDAENGAVVGGSEADGHASDAWAPFSARQDRVKVKGIYVTGPMAGSAAMDDLIELIDTTELNAVVIDVKNDEGNITYQMDLQAAQEMGACVSYIRDMDGLMEKLKSHGIYTIARIVCFKEPRLAEYKPELALKKEDGSDLKDGYGL